MAAKKEKPPTKAMPTLSILTDDEIDLGPEPQFYDAEKFARHAKNLSKEDKEKLLNQMRTDKEFYGKILTEDRRAIVPNSHRYQSAQKAIRMLNQNGLSLKKLIES